MIRERGFFKKVLAWLTRDEMSIWLRGWDKGYDTGYAAGYDDGAKGRQRE